VVENARDEKKNPPVRAGSKVQVVAGAYFFKSAIAAWAAARRATGTR
jgi:hypothetical protein